MLRSLLSHSNRLRLLAPIIVAAALIPGVAGAQLSQQPPVGDNGPTTSSPSTTEPAPGDGSTSTTDPTTTTLPSDTSSTTTTVYIPEIPPELVDDPRLPYLADPDEGAGVDIPIAQQSFDPLSVGVLPDKVTESKLQLDLAVAAWAEAAKSVESAKQRIAALESRVGELDTKTAAMIKRAARARAAMLEHAVDAYISGTKDLEYSVLTLSQPADIGAAQQYMGSLLERQAELADEYERARRGLSEDNQQTAEELGSEHVRLTEAEAIVAKAVATAEDAQKQLKVYESGAHLYISGFVFPLASVAEFINSWGYPRMMGTPSAHWHEGTDIFAPYGAPAIASENGVIDRLGQASLGGNKLWLKGESGVSYYYAHLSAFADGMTNGKRVRAGEVVGYVGDTGNAKGTSPHLHFEIHPGGGDAVNGYPILRAAYNNRGNFKATVETTVPTTVPG